MDSGHSGMDATSHDAPSGHDATMSSEAGGQDGAMELDSGHDAAGLGDASHMDHEVDAHADGASSDAHGHDATEGDATEGDAMTDAHADAEKDAGHDSGVDSGPPTFIQHCNGTPTSLSGTIFAPNGTDPIPEVRVYAAESINPYPANYCDKCSGPIDPAYNATFSAVDGTFTLDLNHVPYGADIDFTIQIGHFRKHTIIPVTACTSGGSVPMGANILPGKSADGDIPKIAVSTGNQDHLDQVLTALGIVEYDCYEGRADTSVAPTCTVVPGKNLADVLSAPATLDEYNMAFLSCAPDAYSTYLSDGYSATTMSSNTQSWVTGGGRMFVTDLSYDYISQAFPTEITWAGHQANPWPIDGADIGCAPPGSGTAAHSALYNTTIDDPSLAQWLTDLGLASGNPSVAKVQGYYQPWATISSVGAGTTTIADGTMPIDPSYASGKCAAPQQVDVPLTTEFSVAGCGRVVFSSFHTYTGTGASASAANEKIMEYLIFAVAQCGG